MSKTLTEALADLRAAKAKLKLELRRALLRHLGVDKLVERAFYEGWHMHAETDSELSRSIMNLGKPGLDLFIQETRLWRSPTEAWGNSDVEEEV